ncbi:MAG: alkaline phosphatase family protein [Candidatus Latescibacterota bacterium]|nr:MAG: alkaline phosphatase family protein [Candidatus Latescibacterota bacterium]
MDYLNTAGVSQRAFETLEHFVSDQPARPDERHTVVFVGIDGAAWNIIDPLIDDGSLPAFARLKREGCYGVLRSTECFVSPPAWCSMMTGRVPEATGIYTFGHWDRRNKEFLPVESSDVTVPAVWDIASAAGRKTGVINVPMTYPVREVNGVLVSGLMTPTQLGDRHTSVLAFQRLTGQPPANPAYAVFSTRIGATDDFSGNRFEFILLDTIDDNKIAYDRVQIDVYATQSRADAQTHVVPIGVFSPWVKIDYTVGDNTEKAWCKVRVMSTGRGDTPWAVSYSRVLFSAPDTDVVFTYPDSMAHVLGREFGYYFPSKFLDRAIVSGYTSDSAKWARFLREYDDWDLYLYVFTQSDNIQHLEGVSPVTREVYQTIDNYLAQIMAELSPNSTLVIASDHGFKRHKYAFDLNRLFEQMNLLDYRGGNGTNEIDHDNTLVFHNMWCLYFNRSLLTRSELQKRGVPVGPTESPRVALVNYLREAGRTLELGENRVPFPIEFNPVATDASGYAPDMVVVGSYDTYLVEFWNLKRPQANVVRLLRPDEQWNHTRDGIFMFYGKGVKRGIHADTGDIQDIAPTMLYLLDLPVGMDMEGRVMTQVFEPGELASRTCLLVDTFGRTARKAAAPDEERESLEKKLRSLGYIHE